MSLVDTVKQTFRVGSLALALAFSSMTINSCSTVIPQVQQTQIDRYSKTVKSQFQSNPSGYFQKTVDEITQDIKEDMERMDGKELEH